MVLPGWSCTWLGGGEGGCCLVFTGVLSNLVLRASVTAKWVEEEGLQTRVQGSLGLCYVSLCCVHWVPVKFAAPVMEGRQEVVVLRGMGG